METYIRDRNIFLTPKLGAELLEPQVQGVPMGTTQGRSFKGREGGGGNSIEESVTQIKIEGYVNDKKNNNNNWIMSSALTH